MKVLLIAHNHPEVRPGGVEAYTLSLYDAMRASAEYEPVLLARTGPPASRVSHHHLDTPFTSVNDDPHQYLIYTDPSDYDFIYGRAKRKEPLTRHLRDFLLTHRPDVVHFQHTLYLGYDAVRVVKNTLPDVPIVYTLHEYLPICHRGGLMLRTVNEELCDGASPRRCSECFPAISPPTFFMRERFVKSHLELVDLFIAPSHTLREHFVNWGLAAEKIVVEPFGWMPAAPARPAATERPRNRFGYFGQLSPHKGVAVLLEAMNLLGPEFEGHLWIHGANLDLQEPDFQTQIGDLLLETQQTVTTAGPYPHSRVSALMAEVDWIVVPSTWWENSPLVIEEAFLHGRPVICSNVGGMAEKVIDGINGLQFERGDPHSLARVMSHAAKTPGIWESLVARAPATRTMTDHLGTLGELYKSLVNRATG